MQSPVLEEVVQNPVLEPSGRDYHVKQNPALVVASLVAADSYLELQDSWARVGLKEAQSHGPVVETVLDCIPDSYS